MKCRSRSTLGIVIGAINILGCVCGCIYLILLLVQTNQNNTNIYDSSLEYTNTVLIILLILCLLMTLLSALLIIGIVKRRHQLMTPWLALAAISLGLSCIHVACILFKSLLYSRNFGALLIGIIVVASAMGIQGLICYKLYTLYKEIRAENLVRPGQILTGGQIELTAEPNNYTPLPAKA